MKTVHTETVKTSKIYLTHEELLDLIDIGLGDGKLPNEGVDIYIDNDRLLDRNAVITIRWEEKS